MNNNRILCVDPSFTPGWVVLEFIEDTKQLSILAHGTSKFEKEKNPYFKLTELMTFICKEYEVTHYIYESQFFKSMYQILGACLGGIKEGILLLNKTSLPKETLELKIVNSKHFNYDYRQIRKILFNDINVDKLTTKKILSKIFSIEDWTLDETDALALGLAYIRQKYNLILDNEVFSCY